MGGIGIIKQTIQLPFTRVICLQLQRRRLQIKVLHLITRMSSRFVSPFYEIVKTDEGVGG